MKILQLTSHLNVGGITTTVVNLAERLKERGHEVIVASGGGALAARLAQDGIPCWRVPLRTKAELGPSVMLACVQLDGMLRRHPIEIIHAHTRVAQVAAHWLSSRQRIPYVTTWHGFYRHRLARRWFPCTGDVTIAISEPVAAHLREVFRVPAERIRLITHGIDTARFDQPPDPRQLEEFRGRLRLSANAAVVGTIARLAADKGIDHVIRSFAKVAAQLPQARLLVVGDGPQRGALAALAGSLGLSSSVIFAGSLPETRTVLALMDVFVFTPATQEGFGLSLLEAMASSRPIIAIRRGGGSSWLIEESRAGLAVEPGDVERLAETIVQLVRDPAFARRLGAQAQQIVRERYDITRMVAEVERVYEECLDQVRGER